MLRKGRRIDHPELRTRKRASMNETEKVKNTYRKRAVT